MTGLVEDIATYIDRAGMPVRGTDEDFGLKFGVSATDAANALRALIQSGIILRAVSMVDRRPLYTYNAMASTSRGIANAAARYERQVGARVPASLAG